MTKDDGRPEPSFDGWIAASEWEPGRPRLRPNDLLVELTTSRPQGHRSGRRERRPISSGGSTKAARMRERYDREPCARLLCLPADARLLLRSVRSITRRTADSRIGALICNYPWGKMTHKNRKRRCCDGIPNEKWYEDIGLCHCDRADWFCYPSPWALGRTSVTSMSLRHAKQSCGEHLIVV